jgi:hypothetical protein
VQLEVLVLKDHQEHQARTVWVVLGDQLEQQDKQGRLGLKEQLVSVAQAVQLVLVVLGEQLVRIPGLQTLQTPT